MPCHVMPCYAILCISMPCLALLCLGFPITTTPPYTRWASSYSVTTPTLPWRSSSGTAANPPVTNSHTTVSSWTTAMSFLEETITVMGPVHSPFARGNKVIHALIKKEYRVKLFKTFLLMKRPFNLNFKENFPRMRLHITWTFGP